MNTDTPDDMHGAINVALEHIEQEHGGQILYAVESGSRVWGFASANSDWDIRFLYVRPREAYLQLDLPRDVIEVMDHEQDLDFAGWDLFKALRLLRKTNPPLIEWLWSPIVYRDGGAFVEQLRNIALRYHTPAAIFGHYLSMARGNFTQYIVNPPLRGELVTLKKYLYVLNPLAAVLYYEQHHVFAPIDFMAKLDGLDLSPTLRSHIDALVRSKRAAAELGTAPRDAVLDIWIAEQLVRLEAGMPTTHPPEGMTAALNAVVAEVLANR